MLRTVRWLVGLGLIALIYTAGAPACLLRLDDLAHAPAMRCSRSPYSIAGCLFIPPTCPQAFLFAYSMREKTHAARHYEVRCRRGCRWRCRRGCRCRCRWRLGVQHVGFSRGAQIGMPPLLLRFMAVGLFPSVQCKCRTTCPRRSSRGIRSLQPPFNRCCCCPADCRTMCPRGSSSGAWQS